MERGRGLAEQVRTRLEDSAVKTGTLMTGTLKTGMNENLVTDPLDELWFRKPVRRHVAEFSAVMGIVFLGISGVILWKGGSVNTAGIFAAVAGAFVLSGYFFPRALHPVWKGWMKLAHVLSIVMTTLILLVAWVLLMIPFAIALKIIGKKVMNTSFRTGANTYWEDRPEKLHDFQLLKRQF